jgi:hypothetical protein
VLPCEWANDLRRVSCDRELFGRLGPIRRSAEAPRIGVRISASYSAAQASLAGREDDLKSHLLKVPISPSAVAERRFEPRVGSSKQSEDQPAATHAIGPRPEILFPRMICGRPPGANANPKYGSGVKMHRVRINLRCGVLREGGQATARERDAVDAGDCRPGLKIKGNARTRGARA